jgi:hypothetical protein
MPLEDAQAAQYDAWEASGFKYDFEQVSLVVDGGHVVGWYTADMFDSDRSIIKEVCHPLYPEEIIAADTTAFKLVRLLRDRPRSGLILFVVDEDAITGTVSPAVFRLPLFRLCLFSLTLELEAAALRAALTNPLASWNVLSEGRRAKAQESLGRLSSESRTRPSDTPALGALLSATMFADKAAILVKRRLLGSGEVESLFRQAERVRNWAAHTREADSVSPLGESALGVATFVEECQEVTAALESFSDKEETG